MRCPGSEDQDERSERLTRNVEAIRGRFLAVAQRAVTAGCREIQVVAHSLGTVIAFHSMTAADPVADPSGDGALATLTRFYTIGSPLEKIRFFWSRLIQDSPGGPAIVVAGQRLAAGTDDAMRWDNFFSSLDLVSGRLQEFAGWPPPLNHAARGLGGLITAHVAYNRNPDFLGLLCEGLTGEAPRGHRRP